MFYAVRERFSNVEKIYSFDRSDYRDEYVDAHEKSYSLSRKELDKRLAHNRKIVRLNHDDSGWVNGLPESIQDVQYMPEYDLLGQPV